jgi:hypothetical protein
MKAEVTHYMWVFIHFLKTDNFTKEVVRNREYGSH